MNKSRYRLGFISLKGCSRLKTILLQIKRIFCIQTKSAFLDNRGLGIRNYFSFAGTEKQKDKYIFTQSIT